MYFDTTVSTLTHLHARLRPTADTAAAITAAAAGDDPGPTGDRALDTVCAAIHMLHSVGVAKVPADPDMAFRHDPVQPFIQADILVSQGWDGPVAFHTISSTAFGSMVPFRFAYDWVNPVIYQCNNITYDYDALSGWFGDILTGPTHWEGTPDISYDDATSPYFITTDMKRFLSFKDTAGEGAVMDFPGATVSPLFGDHFRARELPFGVDLDYDLMFSTAHTSTARFAEWSGGLD